MKKGSGLEISLQDFGFLAQTFMTQNFVQSDPTNVVGKGGGGVRLLRGESEWGRFWIVGRQSEQLTICGSLRVYIEPSGSAPPMNSKVLWRLFLLYFVIPFSLFSVLFSGVQKFVLFDHDFGSPTPRFRSSFLRHRPLRRPGPDVRRHRPAPSPHPGRRLKRPGRWVICPSRRVKCPNRHEKQPRMGPQLNKVGH